MECKQKCDLKKDTCALDCLKGFYDALCFNWEDVNENTLRILLQNLKELLGLLSRKTQSVDERLEQCECSDKTSCYSVGISLLCCLLLDDVINQRHDVSHSTADAEFSMQQQQHMSTLLQFIISRGLLPSLGFSISIMIPKNNQKCSGGDTDLLAFTRCFLRLCDDDGLRDFLLPRHQVSIMAALLQIIYSSDYKQNIACAEYEFYELALKKLITTWSKLEDVARGLLALQGSECRLAPSWLRRACGRLLSSCLMRVNGLYSVVSALLATFGDQMSNWKKAEVVANILSTPPHQRKKEEYFRNICIQACKLLQPHPNRIRDDPGKILLHVLTCTMLDIYKVSPQVVHCYFFNELFRPLNALYFDDEAEPTIEEPFSFTSSFETLHSIFVVFKHPQREDAAKKLVIPHLAAIFAIFTFARQHISHLQSILREVVIESLKLFEDEDAAHMALHICGITGDRLCESIKPIKEVDFHFGDVQELLVTPAHQNSLDDIIAGQDETVRAAMDLLSHFKSLTAPILIHLIKRLEDVAEDVDEPSQLYSSEEQEIVRFRRHKGRLLIFAILSAICESDDSSDLLSDGENICNLMKAVMQKACLLAPNSEHKHINCDSLKTCFALLGLFLLKQPTRCQLTKMLTLVPLLRKISTLPHLGVTERDSAADIALAIATHDPSSSPSPHQAQELFGKLSQEADDDGASSESDKSCELPIKVLKPSQNISRNGIKLDKQVQTHDVDELVLEDDKQVQTNAKLVCGDDDVEKVETNDEVVHGDDEQVQTNDTLVCGDAEQVQKSCLPFMDNTSLQTQNEAIESIYDPSPPIRAAGCRFIAASISNRKMKVTDELCNILLEALVKEEDAFVYLSAIQALVECMDKLPAHCPTTRSSFQRLVQEYDVWIGSRGEAAEGTVLKIGEVIMRMIGKLGDFVEIQTRFLVPVLFRASRDSRPSIRSSALSNLAQIASLSRHSLSSFRHELSDCLCTIAERDNDVTVRRAAVHAIRSLIEHLGTEILQIFPDTMTTFYSTLKRAYTSDVDNAVQLHAQLAVEVLDVIMRDVIFNEPERRSKVSNKQIVFPS